MASQGWSVTLNTGAKIPGFGLGTWQSKPGEVGAAVEVALRAGYSQIDCAHIYGNEAEIGEVLKKCFDEGVIKREDLFVTSKLWNVDHAPEDVIPACQLTLKNLQLSYLDLYLIHSPLRLRKGSSFPFQEEDKLGYDPESMRLCWQSMEKLVDQGLCKAIGISNFSITKTETLLKSARIVPAVNQVECHPYFQQAKLKKYCDKKGIVIQAYAPLGNPSRPSKTDSEPVDMDDPVIKEIAEQHNVTPAQICISFGLHRGMVVIPKSTNENRIKQNLESTKVKLSEDDMKRLTAVDKDVRLFRGEWFIPKGTTWQEAADVEADAKFEL